jgi:hypothetical protein
MDRRTMKAMELSDDLQGVIEKNNFSCESIVYNALSMTILRNIENVCDDEEEFNSMLIDHIQCLMNNKSMFINRINKENEDG